MGKHKQHSTLFWVVLAVFVLVLVYLAYSRRTENFTVDQQTATFLNEMSTHPSIMSVSFLNANKVNLGLSPSDTINKVLLYGNPAFGSDHSAIIQFVMEVQNGSGPVKYVPLILETTGDFINIQLNGHSFSASEVFGQTSSPSSPVQKSPIHAAIHNAHNARKHS